MAINVEITTAPPVQLDVTVPSPLEVELTAHATTIELTAVGPQGPSGPQNLSVGETNTLTGEGLWVQTGLGSDGTGFTFWIEDGQ